MEKNKPWAILRTSRRQYEIARPWKTAKMKRKEFEALIQELPGEFFDHLRDVADTERLADAIFGECSRQSQLVADDPQEKEVLTWIKDASEK